MNNSATHSSRFSDAVYSAFKGSYERCIKICIIIASTIVTLKALSSSFTDLFRRNTGLTSISRVNNYNRDMIKQSDFNENLFLPFHLRNGITRGISFPIWVEGAIWPAVR
ncbi:hypothetical protein [Galbibacter sp.]|uniref:hypothetical protein n=1 Tax=Galbibacter sp. TaxID=2918471 RepID=UPI003A8D5429